MNSKTLKYSELKHQAIELRQAGKMYSEIQEEIGHIPKGTLSGWLKNIELSKEQQERIKEIRTKNGSLGRHIGAQRNHEKRIQRLASIKGIAETEYPLHLNDPLFLAGLTLYLAEGTKKTETFMFMNSDPMLIKFMIQWITSVGGIRFEDLRFRLYIHELYAHENCEEFWQSKLGILDFQMQKTIYKPNGRKYKKNSTYKGCLRIEVKGSELYWKTMTWRDCLYRSLQG